MRYISGAIECKRFPEFSEKIRKSLALLSLCSLCPLWLIFQLFLFFLLPFFLVPARAADLQATVSVSKNRMMTDETVTLTVTLKGIGVERIHLPDLFPPSFTVIDKSDKPSLSQDAFGRPISGRVLRYQLQATAAGRFRLGAFSIVYNGETYKVAGELVEVHGTSANPRSERSSVDAAAEAEPAAPVDVRLSAEVDRARVYVGERVILSIRITHNSSEVDEIKLIDLPQFADFWNKEITLTKHVNPPKEIKINGRPYVTQLIPRFVLYPTTSGKLTIPPLTYSMLAHVSWSAGRTSASTRSLVLKTEPISIEALPLPDAGKPAEFNGAVGRYKLKVALRDRVTRVGTPTRLMLEIETNGNLDALTPPPLPQLPDAKVYDLNRVAIKAETEQAPPIARWEADIVPTAAGQLIIPPITFAYFDPVSRGYQILKSEPLPLEVAAVETGSPVSARKPSSNPVSRLLASRVLRYSLLALLLTGGLGVAFLLSRWQRVGLATSPPIEPMPGPSPVAQEIRKLVNSSYGKLHRGDERAYSGDLLRALRLIFESGFAVPPSELTVEKISELLRQRGVDEALCRDAMNLYQECERLCFSPTQTDSARESSFTRFNQARSLIFNLLELIEK